VIMNLAGTQVVGAFRERISEKPGQYLHITPDPALVHLFDEQTGTRLN
jgi:multiple sugar transport system ATP-binding protein